jgi:hypothetical protein
MYALLNVASEHWSAFRKDVLLVTCCAKIVRGSALMCFTDINHFAKLITQQPVESSNGVRSRRPSRRLHDRSFKVRGDKHI